MFQLSIYKRTFLFFLLFSLFCFDVSAQSDDKCDEGDDDECQGGCGDSGGGGATISWPIVHSLDPNDITGNLGYGEEQWVSVNDNLGYKIRFENDPEFATAPAQVVRITCPLDENVDLFSFRLSDFGFGSFNFQVPPNSSYYSSRLDVIDSLGVYVDITAGIDAAAREAFWSFSSIDPLTGLAPEDGLTGFLPVNDTTVTIYTDTIVQKGEGFVSFTIDPNRNAITGDTIHEQAIIIFDLNEEIPTNIWTNIIDAFPPESDIVELPVNSIGNQIELNFIGSDDSGGVGIAFYDLYISKDDGEFYRYEENIDTNSYTFTGEIGSTYRFYSLATDHVGNKEAPKDKGDTTTTFGEDTQAIISLLTPNENSTYCSGDELEIIWEMQNIDEVDILVSENEGLNFYPIATNITSATYTWMIPFYFGPKDYVIKVVDSETNTIESSSGFFLIGKTDNINIYLTSCNPEDISYTTEVFTSQYGCDSVVHTNITYEEFEYTEISGWTCIDSLDATWTYDTLTTFFGCDSIVATYNYLQEFEIDSISNDQVICAGDEVQLEVIGGDFYEWSPSESLSDATISNPVANPSQSTDYTVIVTNAEGCTTEAQVTIDVEQLDSPEILLSEEDYLYVEEMGNYTYQWFVDGQAIPDATNSVYIADFDGIYTILITSENDCSVESLPYDYTVGIEQIELEEFTLVPNPAKEFVKITLETTTPLEEFQLELIDLTGKTHYSYSQVKQVGRFESILHLDQLSAGMYIVYIRSKQSHAYKKLVVVK